MASIATSRYGRFWSPGRLLVVVLWFCTLSASVDGSLSEAEPWLKEYGYLVPQSSSIPIPYSLLSEAIRNMQTFYNLQVTGRLNPQTIRAMKQPRCGVPDKHTKHTTNSNHLETSGTKWDHFHLTYSVESFAPNLAWQDTLNAIRKAFQVWENASPFTFEEIDSSVADIMVSFHNGLPPPVSDVAHGYFPGTGNGGDVHFNSDRHWIRMDQNVQGSFNVFLVAVHELGHSLGLEHSSDPRSIMHPSYQWTETEDFQLSEDVRQEIQQLYSNCPSGWQMFENSCYYMYTTDGDWQQARDFCLRQRADLVVINSGEEQEFIRLMKEEEEGEESTWIGLRWTGRRWTWVDGTRLTTEYWADGEPDEEEISNCAVLDYEEDGEWLNYPCSSQFEAICEKSVR